MDLSYVKPTVELRVDCVKSFDAVQDSVEIDGSLANVLIPGVGWSDVALGSNNVTQHLLCEHQLGTRATIAAWKNCTNVLDEAALINCPPEAVDVVQDCKIEMNNASQCVVPICFELGNATAVSSSSASGLVRLHEGNKVEVLTPEGSWEALGESETNSADAICADLGFEFGGVELQPVYNPQVRWRIECVESVGTLTDSCFFDKQRRPFEMRIRCSEDGVIPKYSRDLDKRFLVVSEAGKLSQVCVRETVEFYGSEYNSFVNVDNELYATFGRAACSSLGLDWNPKGGDSRLEIINTDKLLHKVRVECPTTASSLDDCAFDFDVQCLSSLAIVCDEPEPRVAVDPSSGLVTVAEGRVGTATRGVVLGGDSFDARAARVTCRELGFAFGRVIPASLVKSNDVKLEPRMANVRCKGTESSLLDCQYSDKRTGFGCELDNARGLGVGVSCFSPDKPRAKVARHGVDQQQLEVFVGGKFGSVCGPIGDAEARVFCRSQGFDDGAAKPSSLLDPRHVAVFPPILNHLRCKGNEDDIWSCRYDRRGLERCGFVAEVICFNAEEPIANPNSGFEQVSDDLYGYDFTGAPVEVGLAHDGESLLLNTGGGLHLLYFSLDFQLQAKLASVFCRMLGRESRGEFTLVDHPLADSFERQTGRINGFSYAGESPFDGQYDSETSLYGFRAPLGLRCHSARFPERVARFSPNGKRVVFWADGFWGMATSKFGVSRSAKCHQERTRFGKLLSNRESNVACQMMGFRYGQRQKDIRATIKEDYGRGERVVTTQVEGLASSLLFPRMQFWDVDCKGKEASLFHCDVLRRKSDIENLDDAAQFNNPSFDDFYRDEYNSFNNDENSRNSELLTAKCFGPERALRSDKILRREWFNRLDVLNVDKMIWGTVCALDRDAFDLRAATVACRQLDSDLYALGQPHWSQRNDVQGTPDMAVFSQGFRCSGDESSLLDCDHIPVTDHAACSTHEHDVSVRCLTKEAVNDAELVMMDNEQRLSIKLFGEHKMVCAGSVVAGDQYFAKIACGELGFRTGTWSAVPLATQLGDYERLKALHWGVHFMCPSNDFSSSILECVWPASERVACNEAVRLECSNTTDPSPLPPSVPRQVLVADVDVVKVQVPSMGTFFLCPALLGHDEAQALCRSLGHDANTIAKVGHITRPSFAFEPTQYLDLGCNETDSLDTCELGPIPLQSCPMDQAATLLCEHPSPPLEPLELRLVKSRRVEIRDADSGKWSTLCKNYHVSSATATIMCREIQGDDSLLGEVVELKKSQRAGKKVPISRLNMWCTGEESSLGDCQKFSTSCDSHKDDLGIRCIEDGLGPQASVVRVRDSQLEVFSTEKMRWGSVCGWVTDTVAQIACDGQGRAIDPRWHSVVPQLWKVRGIARNTTALGLGLLDDDETCDRVARVSCGRNLNTVRLKNDQLNIRGEKQYYQRRDSDAPWRVGTAMVSCRSLGALSPVMINNLRRAHERRGIRQFRCNGAEIRPDLCPSRKFKKLHMIPFGLRCLGDSRQGARFRLDQDKRVFLVFNNDDQQVPVDPHAMGIWEATQVCRQNGFAGVDLMTSSRLGSLDSKYVVRSLSCNSTQFAVDDLLLCNHHLEKRKPSAKEVLVLQCRSTSTSAPSFVVSEPPDAAWGQGCPNTSSKLVEYRGWQLSCLCHDERCVEWADETTCADREARCEWFTPPDGGERRCVASFDKVGCPRYSPVWSAPFISWHLENLGRQQRPTARHFDVYYSDPGQYADDKVPLVKNEYSELYSASSEVEVVVKVDAFPSLQLVNLHATKVPFCRDLAMFAALQRFCMCGSTSCKAKRSKSSCATKGDCAWVSGFCVGDPVLLNQDERCSSYHPRSIATAFHGRTEKECTQVSASLSSPTAFFPGYLGLCLPAPWTKSQG
ncbi:Scavenger receptor cysteine-rich type 1 protein M130 (CD antigen CD163) [Cleaved into: Soluble CD163 (sCD163)] [Durusdinium trenchii]|uniref:Scavenger receptor cysteine-rich type 1 protein M130 (CD antigen CD163) [Cleaved into: Soluble CD163 (SCD163)] n=1 Tax=Durusdinium trenchii TaxID=1381693 RepID=A0ABP0SAV4_9DINO